MTTNADLTEREYRIMKLIWNLQSDIEMETYDAAYDEGIIEGENTMQGLMDGAYEDGKNTGYDAGFEDALNLVLETVLQDKNNLVATPTSVEACTNILTQSDNPTLAFLQINNYYVAKVKGLKVDT